MNLPQYITFKVDNSEDLFLLQTGFPHYICQIIRYQDPLKVPDGIGYAQVPGYGIYIVFRRALQGNQILGSADLQKTLDAMALYYFMERIEKDPVRYKRFKLIM